MAGQKRSRIGKLGAGTALEAGHIWISKEDGQIRELAEESFLIHAMRNKSTRKTRGYVHRKHLDAIKEAI